MAEQDLSVIRRTYDLVLWYVPHLNRVPRTHRFGLAQRVVQTLYDLLEGLLEARFSMGKAARLASLNAKVDVLRYQTRLMKDFDSSPAPVPFAHPPAEQG